MQKLIAYRLLTEKRMGNFSGTGAGKTLGAILASRVCDSKLTVIICPNAVVSNWEKNIELTFKGTSFIHTTMSNYSPSNKSTNHKYHYLILNYEKFQQPDSENRILELVKNRIDMVVLDEVHYSKQTNAKHMSKRRQMINGLLSHAKKDNPDLMVMGLSATPVVNNLMEGKSLLEMIQCEYYDDLSTKATIPNAIALFEKFATMGVRQIPKYDMVLNTTHIDVDCSDYLDDIRAVAKGSILELESVLTQVRLNTIVKNIVPQTVIYTSFIGNGIRDVLYDAIVKAGWSVGFYMGDDKSGLDDFLKKRIDVLIGTDSIATGVDGLQDVSNRLILNTLPWTNAQYTQLIGRLYRQGQVENKVEIIIPRTYADVNGGRWSYCDSKWARIQYKRTLGDCAVDGVIPQGQLRSPDQAKKDAMEWLDRLESEGIQEVYRPSLDVELTSQQVENRLKKYGDFSKMNRWMNQSKSETTAERFRENPELFEHYHRLYREAREKWKIIPFNYYIDLFKERPQAVIGDFGCGEAMLAQNLPNKVYSFDHVALNDHVTVADISNVPLEDESLDAVVFSLSLMGSNFIDYIKEAFRTIKLDGFLHIVEATSRFKDVNQFCDSLESIGFGVERPKQKGQFTFIKATKSSRQFNDSVDISL